MGTALIRHRVPTGEAWVKCCWNDDLIYEIYSAAQTTLASWITHHISFHCNSACQDSGLGTQDSECTCSWLWTAAPVDLISISPLPGRTQNLTARELRLFARNLHKYACHLFALFPPRPASNGLHFGAKVEAKLCEPCAVRFGHINPTQLY